MKTVVENPWPLELAALGSASLLEAVVGKEYHRFNRTWLQYRCGVMVTSVVSRERDDDSRGDGYWFDLAVEEPYYFLFESPVFDQPRKTVVLSLLITSLATMKEQQSAGLLVIGQLLTPPGRDDRV